MSHLGLQCQVARARLASPPPVPPGVAGSGKTWGAAYLGEARGNFNSGGEKNWRKFGEIVRGKESRRMIDQKSITPVRFALIFGCPPLSLKVPFNHIMGTAGRARIVPATLTRLAILVIGKARSPNHHHMT